MPRPRKALPVSLIGILLLAAAARIINTGGWPVWTDEGWTTWAISEPGFGVILDKVRSDTHPPLYFLTLGAWSALAGESRIALRALAIFAGLLTIAITYRIGADWFGRAAGGYAALLLATLDIAIYYSQEIRHYGFLTLSTSLTTLLFLRILRGSGRPRPTLLVAYGVSVALTLYSMYLGALILAIHAGIGLAAWRGSPRAKAGLIGAWAAAGAMFAPWLGVILSQSDFIFGTVGGLARYPTTPEGVLTVSGFLFGGQIALTGALYFLGTRQVIADRGAMASDPTRWLAQMTVLLCGIGLFGAMIAANLRIALLIPRFLVFLSSFIALACGYGLSLIADRPARRALATGLIAISLLTVDFRQPRLNSDDAARALAAEYTPGDLIILENGWDDNAFRYEIRLALHHIDPTPRIIRTLPWVDNRRRDVPVVPQVEGELRAHRRVWVVNWLQPPQVIPYLDSGAEGFERALSREIPVVEEYRALFPDPVMDVALYARPDPAIAPRQYGDLFMLRGALFASTARRGGRLHVDLWWSALRPPGLDYSVGVFLLDDSGTLRAQHDGPPGGTATSRWTPDMTESQPIFDRHSLPLAPDLLPGEYRLGVQVYWYGDPNPLDAGGERYAILGVVRVE